MDLALLQAMAACLEAQACRRAVLEVMAVRAATAVGITRGRPSQVVLDHTVQDLRRHMQDTGDITGSGRVALGHLANKLEQVEGKTDGNARCGWTMLKRTMALASRSSARLTTVTLRRDTHQRPCFTGMSEGFFLFFFFFFLNICRNSRGRPQGRCELHCINEQKNGSR